MNDEMLKVWSDMSIHGSGYYKTDEQGNVTHVPFNEVIIEPVALRIEPLSRRD